MGRSNKKVQMKKIGIITIHKINNYGSVLQAYALQKVCESLGFKTELIDYLFPNEWQIRNKYATTEDLLEKEPKWIKLLFAYSLIRQHKGISTFVKKYQNLSSKSYSSPSELEENPPEYDIYITGSDQLWNPRYCNGDPSYLLHFAPDKSRKVSYAASFGTKSIPYELTPLYHDLLARYDKISVRESEGVSVIKSIIGREAEVMIDPTLLLDMNDWNAISNPRRLINKKYILCYFLNYTFNAFPYVDQLATYIQKQTGFEIVRVARPPHRLSFSHTKYLVGASPEEYLSLVRDAELVLTTSFHGTAFALNYGKPVLSIVKNKDDNDSRQASLMNRLGLEQQIVSISDPFPTFGQWNYNIAEEQSKLAELRNKSLSFLRGALEL